MEHHRLRPSAERHARPATRLEHLYDCRDMEAQQGGVTKTAGAEAGAAVEGDCGAPA